MSQTATSASINRCQRCNRKLKDPSAKYGWRCAEILGITQELNCSGDGSFREFILAMNGARDFLCTKHIDLKKINLINFYESYAKHLLAEGMNDLALSRLAYKNMQSSLILKRDENENLIAETAQMASLSDLLNARDVFDYQRGRYSTTLFTNNSFDPYTYALQQLLNTQGRTDKFGNKLKEDGIFGPKTQWALDAGQAMGDIGKGLIANGIQSKYGIYRTGGATVFGIVDKSLGRIKNGEPVGVPIIRIDGPHANAPTPHLNTTVGRFDHTEIPQWVYRLAKSGNKLVHIAKTGGKAVAVVGAALDVYELGSTIYYDLNDADGKLGKKTLQISAGIGGSYIGGFGGAKLGAMGGATLGTCICPGLGTVIGGVLGGIGGGIAGALGGRSLGEHVVDQIYQGE